jgi:hypothetical protein
MSHKLGSSGLQAGEHVTRFNCKGAFTMANTLSPSIPRVVPLSAGARALYRQFARYIEQQMPLGGGLDDSSPEHAARLGTVIAGFRDPDIVEVSTEDYRRGMHLVLSCVSETWHLPDALR